MPKTITIKDVKVITLTVSLTGNDRMIVAARYERLDEDGEAIPDFYGNIQREVTGGRRQAIENFMTNQILPFLRQEEGIE